MSRKRILRALAAVVLAAFAASLLTGCGVPAEESAAPAQTASPASPTPAIAPSGGAEKRDGVFTLNYHPDYNLNPFTCDSEINRQLCCLLFEPLVAVTPDFQPEPALCTAWDSEDGWVFTLTLRENAQFTDGTALSFWDVLYSLNRAMESGSVYAERLRCVQSVEQVEGRVVITLKEPNPSFPLRLELPVVKEGSAYLDLPTGTGPYVLAEGEGYQYLRASETWPGADSLPLGRIYLENYPMEEVSAAFDASFLDLAVTEGGNGALFHTGVQADRHAASTSILYYLGVNWAGEALADPARRRLVASAIDRQSAAAILGGDAALLPVSPATAYYDGAIARRWLAEDLTAYGIEILTEDYDGDGYREYLAEGEQRDFLLRLLVCEENPVSLAAARSLAADLEAAGIQVRLQALDLSGYRAALKSRDYDLYFASMRLSADFDLSSLLCPGGAAYPSGGDGELAALTEAFRAAALPDRMEAAKALYDRVAETCPLIPLAFGRRTVVTLRGAVSGLDPSWTNPFLHLTSWRVTLDG